MLNRKIAAYTVVLTAIIGVVNSFVLWRKNRRFAALESRIHEVECDVNATVDSERMRTALPVLGDTPVPRDRASQRLGQR